METDSAGVRWSCQPAHALLAAAGVVILGTAAVDPTRLRLLLVPGSFLVLAFGAGALVDRVIGGLMPGTDQRAEGPSMLPLAVHLGVGLACLSLLAVLAALCGVFWVAGVAAVPLLAYGLLRLIRGLSRLRRDAGYVASAAAGLVMGAGWLVAWLWVTTPPVFYDELAYHFPSAQRALLIGELKALPWDFFTLMPHASDVLRAWGMAFEGELGARATHFALWVAVALVAWALAEAVAWPKPALLAAPMVAGALAASPTLWFLATLSFGETGMSVAVGTAIALLAVPYAERRPWLALGLVLGLATTIKLTGLYWAAAGLAAAAVARWPRADLLRAACLVLVSVAPWWGRALVHTGNPIYPMGYGLLGGRFWSEESQALVKGDVAYGLADLGLQGLFRLPLDLWQHPERFGSGADAGALALAATAALLAWPAVSRLAGASERTRRLSDLLAMFVLVAGAGWLVTSTTTRFFAPAMVIGLATLAGAMLSLGRTGQVVAMTVLLMAGGWGTWRFIDEHSAVFSSYQVALGREKPNAYLDRQLEHFAAARYVQHALPSDARLLFIGETRTYYFFRDSVAPSAYDRHPLKQWVEESSSPEAVAARLADEGITHVVLNVHEFKRHHDRRGLLAFSGPSAEVNERRLKELPSALTLLFKKNGVLVFEVPPRSSATRLGNTKGSHSSRPKQPGG